MKRNLYVTSTQIFSGKSALCAGLLRRFQADGLNVGYMKPVSTHAIVNREEALDEDVLFMRKSFGLTDAGREMAPVILNDRRVEEILTGETQDFTERVKAGYDLLSRDRDIMVLEGGGNLREAWIVGLSPPQVADLLGSAVLVVVPFDRELQLVDDLITARVRFGDALLGAVINRVPRHKMSLAREKVSPFVQQRGVRILSILPRERILLSVSVEELLDGLGGEVLCGADHLDGLVEHLMVGAMSVDSALTYFRRKPNKAVITGGDRPDIQLAALETSTKCLILTGNLRPASIIIGKAEKAGVPVILTHHDTLTAVEIIEGFFGKTRFHQEEKIRRFDELLAEHMDFKGLYAALGLKKPA